MHKPGTQKSLINLIEYCFTNNPLQINLYQYTTRYDYNLTIIKSPKPATDNRFK